MCRTTPLLLISVLLLLFVPGESKSSLIKTFPKFAAHDRPNVKSFQTPPSQSPSPITGLDSRGENDEHGQGPSNSPKAELIARITDERCNISLNLWCRDSNKITACVSNGGTGPEEPYLVVQNDEDTPAKVNLTILPSNITFKEIELLKHQAKKINSEIIGESQSIVLNAGNWNCTIPIASPAAKDNYGKNFQWRGTNLKPTHGAYVLVLMVLIGGGGWSCFNLRKRGRRLDDVPYQELEMGQPDTISAVNVKTRGGCDEDWDDDLDEEKAVKSPGGKPLRHGKANGNDVAPITSHDDGWGNDWDD